MKFFNKEISGLHEAAYLLGFFTLLSQVLALVRDRLLASSFGAGHDLDIYYAAFRIPDFIFVLVASIVSVSVLIPFLVEKLDKDEGEAKKFIDNIFSAFFLTITGVSIVVYFFVPALIDFFFPSFAEFQTRGELIFLTRVLLFSPIFLGLSNFFGSITQIYNRFFIYALSPVIYNFGIIIGIIFLRPFFGIYGLAYGVVLGAFFHLAIQIPFVWSRGLLPKFTFHFDPQSIKAIILVSLPRTLAVSANEIAEFVLISFASFMSVGSISVFNFSWNLQSVPLGIIGVSYSLAAFPTLTRHLAQGNKIKYVEQMVVSARHIIFLCMPITALFVVLRAQIVRVILGSGNFNWHDTRLTAAALAIFALSLIPQSLVLLFARAYYAGGNTKKPLLINVLSSILIVVSGFALIRFFDYSSTFRFFIESLFKVDSVPGTSILMLPLAYSFGVSVNALIHWLAFHFDFPNFSRQISRTAFQIFSASVIMGFTAYQALNIFDKIFDINTFVGIFLQGFLSGIIAIIVGVIILKLLKSRELGEIWTTLHHKIWKANAISSSLENVSKL
ncbi:MAG: murein biosynthesis integral membrane protein MurJ [Parcubacteria group bacterium]|nr:murein biosynthesis integral membrane protein MurJ [Parcubacteria group bacterium]